MLGRIGIVGLFFGVVLYGWLRVCFDIFDNMCLIVFLRFFMFFLLVWFYDVYWLLVLKFLKMVKLCKKLFEIKVDEEYIGLVLNMMVYLGFVSLFGV